VYNKNDIIILCEALFNVWELDKYKNFEEIYKDSDHLMDEVNRYDLFEYITKKGINKKINRQIIQLFLFFDYNLNIKNHEKEIKQKIDKIKRMDKIKARMCFWAINVYLVNLTCFLFLDGIDKVETVRDMIHKQIIIDSERLLREQLKKFCLF